MVANEGKVGANEGPTDNVHKVGIIWVEREGDSWESERESQKRENVKEAKISDTSLTDIGVTG